MKIKYLAPLSTFLATVSIASAATVLSEDTFDRANSSDINLDSGPDQSGMATPTTYNTYGQGTSGNDSSIVSNRLSLNANGTGDTTRASLQHNLSDFSSTIVNDGGFEVVFTVDSGINWFTGPHSAYTTEVFLSEQTIVNSTINPSNSFQGLALRIQGNGKIEIWSQGIELFDQNVNAWNVSGLNEIRLVVETDGFLATSTNSAALYVNGSRVTSGKDFDWRTGEDISVGFRATGNTSEFTKISIITIR